MGSKARVTVRQAKVIASDSGRAAASWPGCTKIVVRGLRHRSSARNPATPDPPLRCSPCKFMLVFVTAVASACGGVPAQPLDPTSIPKIGTRRTRAAGNIEILLGWFQERDHPAQRDRRRFARMMPVTLSRKPAVSSGSMTSLRSRSCVLRPGTSNVCRPLKSQRYRRRRQSWTSMI